jgi:UV DNA damage endonuclease
MRRAGQEPAEDVKRPIVAGCTETVKAGAWFVYILRCSDGSLYTGITKDVERRSEQHNAGTASRYTRSRLPVQVEYQESRATRSSALKREAEVKAMARMQKESLITRAGAR